MVWKSIGKWGLRIAIFAFAHREEILKAIDAVIDVIKDDEKPKAEVSVKVETHDQAN